MKKIVFFCFALLSFLAIDAQIVLSPVQNLGAKKTHVKVPGMLSIDSVFQLPRDTNVSVRVAGMLVYQDDVLYTCNSDLVFVAAVGGGGSGSTNDNIGTYFRWAVPGTNNIKSFRPRFGIDLDSTATELGIIVDTVEMATKAALADREQAVRAALIDTAANIRADFPTGGGGAELEGLYGTLYNGSDWANLNDFSQSGSGTWSASSGNISSSGGTGVFTNTLNLKDTIANERWRIYIRFSPSDKTATSYGIGVGLRSVNGYTAYHALGRISLATGANEGKVYLNGSTAHTQLNVSATGVSYSVGDSIVMIVERKLDSLFISAYNHTTASAAVTTSYKYSISTSPYMPNTGTLSVYAFGGTQLIDSINIQTNTVKNSALAIVGDSKTVGYIASAFESRIASQLNLYYPSTIALPGGSDRTAEVLARVDEIIYLNPTSVILCIGSNDIRSSVTTGTWQANYSAIVSRLEAAGITVYHMVPRETSIDVSALQTFVVANWPGNVIAVWQAMSPSPATYLNADGVHPNQTGQDLIVSTIRNFGQIERGVIQSSSSTVSDVTFTDGSGFDGTVSGSGTKAIALTTSLTTGSVPFIGASGALSQDNTKLFWDNTNKKLLIGSGTGINTLFKLEVGTTQKFTVTPDYVGNGDIAASSVMMGSSTGNFSFFANTSTGGTGTLMGAYYNGSNAKSAWEVSNTVGGATSTLILMKGGGPVRIGTAGTALGQLQLTGNTSGTITIQGQAAAGTYNFNLPTTAGSSGQVLTSGGGGSTAMTWTTLPTLAYGTATPTLTNTTNITSSTAYDVRYIRVGDVVYVAGSVDIRATATGAVELRMTVPVTTSSFGTDKDADGVGSATDKANGSLGIMAVSGTQVVAFKFVADDTSDHNYRFEYSYTILPG